MKTLHVTVSDKIATYLQRDGEIVCGNSDYQIQFTFDSEWGSHSLKTARFIRDGGVYEDVVFTGNTCPVPILKNTKSVSVGVYAGSLSTTTPAVIGCKKSILCEDGLPEDPTEDVYTQILEKIDEAVANGGGGAIMPGVLHVVHSLGDSETAVMSQKAVTENLADLADSSSLYTHMKEKFIRGGYAQGQYEPNTIRVCTDSTMWLVDKIYVEIASGFKVSICKYNSSTPSYDNCTDDSNWIGCSVAALPTNVYCTMAIAKTDDTEITIEEAQNAVKFINSADVNNALSAGQADSKALDAFLKTWFSQHGIGGTGGLASSPKRVCIPVALKFPNKLFIDVPKGYRIAVCTFSDSVVRDENMLTNSGWIYDSVVTVDSKDYVAISTSRTDDGNISVEEAQKAFNFRVALDERIEDYHYTGEPINFGKHTFKVKELVSSLYINHQGIQGFDIHNGVIAQFESDNHLILLDLVTGGKISEYKCDGGHGGSLTFSNKYKQSGDEFPLLYIAGCGSNGRYDPIIWVRRISRTGTTLEAQIKYSFANAGYWCTASFDFENEKMYLLGHTEDSYLNESGKNSMKLTVWNMSSVTNNADGTISYKLEKTIALPYVNCVQTTRFFDGKIFVLYSSTTAEDTEIHVLDPENGNVLSKFTDFPLDIKKGEGEGLTFADTGDSCQMVISAKGADKFTYYGVTFASTGGRGEKGEKGDQGPKGEKGDPFTYNDFTAEQLATLKGEKGDKGDKGGAGANGTNGTNGKSAYEYAKDGGYTGTEAEFAEDVNPDNINANSVNFIATELAKRGQLKPEFANSVEECTDTTKLYVLPNGFIYAHLYNEVTVEPTNAIPTSTDEDRKTIYNGKGYKLGVRINSSGAITSSSAPAEMGVTGFIPAKPSDVIDIDNWVGNQSYTNYIAAYDASNTLTGKMTLMATTPMPITLDAATFGSNFNAIRISGNLTDATSIINKSNGGTASGYAWSNTGHAFVPADYEDRIIELEEEVGTLNNKLKKASVSRLSVSEVFAPSPQLPADGSETADFNGIREYITAEQIYDYIDELLNLYPRFITKEILGKDASGTHDWCRYVCSRRSYDAWQKPNYPPMYAWVNGSTTIYSVSVSPRIGDTLYTTAYIGTAKGAVTAVSNANQSRTVGGVVYTRDNTKDIEPTLVYTETGYSPYFSSNYAGTKNGIYDGSKAKISTISSMNNGTLTGANGISYSRYPFGDKNSKFESIPAIVIGGNEHGTGGDPATPAMISARIVKDLCECKNMNNPFLNLLKNEYMVVFCPVVNPWGLHKDNQSYYNANGVNLDRNFDTIGWGGDTSYPQGAYGGSENETQYFMNTLVASKCKIAMCNHSYGEGRVWESGVEKEAVSGGICSYMFGEDWSKYDDSLLEIAEVMASNYNLVFKSNDANGVPALPNQWAKTRSYFASIGIDGVALEINSRDGFITDPNNEAQGKQFTARVMEAAYTQLLQVLYMMIDKQDV